MDNRAIGYIDSGVGGLTVVKEALQKLPNEQVVYLGDEARMPYGPRPAHEVIEFTLQMADFLIEQKDIKMLVVACNTASARALPALKEKYDLPIIGVISPSAAAAVQKTSNQKIAVIATQSTVDSEEYPKQMMNIETDLDIRQLPAGEFVTLVESGNYDNQEGQKIVDDKLVKFGDFDFDTIVLGCTHFPMLEKQIINNVGDYINIVNSGTEVIKDVLKILEDNNLRAQAKKDEDHYYTTGSLDRFSQIANAWLEKDVDVKKLNIKNGHLIELDK